MEFTLGISNDRETSEEMSGETVSLAAVTPISTSNPMEIENSPSMESSAP